MKKRSNILATYILTFCSCMIIVSCGSKSKEGREDSFSVEKTTEASPRSVVAFRQEMKGYQVEIEYLFEMGSEVEGDAVVKLSKRGRSYEAVCPDTHVPESWVEKLQSADTLWMDYTAPQPDAYLSDESPVYFKDMDFDGEDELVVMHKGCGWYGSNEYDVFKFDENGVPRRLTGEPWEWLKQKMSARFNVYLPEAKSIVCYFSSAGEFQYSVTYKWNSTKKKLVISEVKDPYKLISDRQTQGIEPEIKDTIVAPDFKEIR